MTAEKHKLPYADDVNYWKTGTKKQPDRLLDDACQLIQGLGGRIQQRVTGTVDGSNEAYRLQYVLQGKTHVIVWPVLKTKKDAPAELLAARRQAAAFIYHDIKAKCCNAKILGIERAFFDHSCLPDGRPVVSLGLPDLENLPKLELKE